MKDVGEASYAIKIHRDRFRGILGLSQETYINKFLERFRMKNCSPCIAPIMKGDRFNLDQCPRNDLEREQMKNIPYASAVGSLMYAQVCTRPDIAFVVGMLGRYQSNPGIDHWRAAIESNEVPSRNLKTTCLCIDRRTIWKSLATQILTLLDVLIHANQHRDTFCIMEECQADFDCHFHYGSRFRLLFLRLLYMVYGLRVSFLGLELWILSLSH